jgi:cyclophilin family peptidyl-prolyl cis-trans isomerase
MRAILALLLILLTVPMGLAQAYRPKPGETVMKIEIEGRGDVYVRLFTKEAPRTTAHIQKLVRNGFYNGQRFHRVERSPRPYLAQIGDPASRSGDLANAGNGGSGARIPYEDSGFEHRAGMVGLARTVQDPNSGDSQFYITLAPAKFLDGKYTVFGRVVDGMDVVRKIERGDRVVSVSIL